MTSYFMRLNRKRLCTFVDNLFNERKCSRLRPSFFIKALERDVRSIICGRGAREGREKGERRREKGEKKELGTYSFLAVNTSSSAYEYSKPMWKLSYWLFLITKPIRYVN